MGNGPERIPPHNEEAELAVLGAALACRAGEGLWTCLRHPSRLPLPCFPTSP